MRNSTRLVVSAIVALASAAWLSACVVRSQPGYVQTGYVQTRPVYVQPRPVYVQTQPVYVQPAQATVYVR